MSRYNSIWAALLWAVTIPAMAAPKTDLVEFGNGSRLVGELKYLDRGKLNFKTDTTDTIALDWADIQSLVTKQRLRILQRDGTFHYGSLEAPVVPRTLLIAVGQQRVQIDLYEIVDIDPIESTIWERLDLDVSAGYAFTKSTEVEQWNVGFKADYETDTRSRVLLLSVDSTASSDVESSVRSGLAYQTMRLREDRWATGWLTGVESNDALALDYRVTAAFGGGPRFYPTPDQRFRTFAGLQINNEKFAGAEAQSSVEAIVGGSIDWYRFRDPDLDLSTTAYIMPSLTDSGRLRGSLDLSLKWEFIKDFYWQISLYDDYDNAAETDQASDAATNDYGISTSVGWSP